MKQGIYSLSDQLFYAWMIERNVESIIHEPLSEFFNASVFYPYHNTLAFGDHLLGETFLAAPFYLVTQNPVFAENVLILISFVLSAYGMFLLVKYHTNNTLVALIGGALFSFSNVRFNQYDHLNIISIEWLPFIFLYLDKFIRSFKTKYLALLGIFYLLTILLTIYYLIMVSLAIFLYVFIAVLFYKIEIVKNRKGFLFLLATLGICVLIVTPTLLPYLRFSREFPEVRRVIQDNIIYSASIFSYLTTARSTVYSKIAGLSGMSESDVGMFPGFVLLSFCSLSVYLLFKKWQKYKDAIFFGILSTIFIILSFGPFLKLTPETLTSLPLPYFYLYYLLSPFQIMRVPARFAIFTQLFLVLFASIGMVHVMSSIHQKRRQYIVTVALMVTIFAETYSVFMPLTLVETKQDFPKIYYWLKEQSQNSTVLELPIPLNKQSVANTSQKVRHDFMENLSILDRDNVEAYRNYFSLLHNKRIVNGYSAYTPPIYREVAESAQDFPDEKSIKAIRDLNVDYIIVHVKQYPYDLQMEVRNGILTNGSIQVIKQFGDDYAVKIK
jgi:hypothetical protein